MFRPGSIFRKGYKDTSRDRALATMNNVLYHMHPVKVKRHGLKLTYTFCLGRLPPLAPEAGELPLVGRPRGGAEHTRAMVRAPRARASVRGGALPLGPLLADPQGWWHLGTPMRSD